MVETRTESIDFGDAPPGGGQGLAMRGQIAATLFGDVAQPVRIGRFEVLEEIGAGGMGVVYRARDPKLDRDVAIKVMLTEQVSARGRARLVREAQTLAKLNHPHVVTVYEVAEHESQVFVAMEFVAGGNLRDWLHEGDPSRAEILARFVAAGQGLAAAHEAGIVHRDFKPANVLLGVDGRVRVADFGLARDDGSRDTSDSSGGATSAPKSESLTKTGSVIGTPAYMAPEQWARKSVTPATDQFAYCMSVWQALAGVLPYEHATVRGAAKAGELGEPRGGDALGGRVRKALLRGLAVDPADRWPNLDALVEALEPGGSTPWRGFAVVAVVAGVIGAAAADAGGVGEESASPCSAVRARMDALWNDEERARLEALHAGSAPFAAASWPEIDAGIERFVASWDAAESTVCAAAGAVDASAVSCLEESTAQLGTFVGRVGDTDAQVVSRLPMALASLRSPESCASPALRSRRPAPPPGTPALARVRETRSLLEEALLSLDLGDFGRAESLVRDAQEVARASGFPPVIAEVEVVSAKLALEAGDAATARSGFEAALSTAQASRHDEAVLGSLVGYLRSTAFASGRSEELDRWVGLAEATLQRTRGGVLRTDLDEARLDVLRLTDRTSKALELATSLSERGDETSSFFRRAWARRQRGHLLAALGETADAEAIYTGLLRDSETRLGPSHPEVAALHSSLGILYLDERSEDAAESFQKALDIIENAFGSDHVAYARNALGLAQAKAMLGDLDTAKELAARASDIQLRLLTEGDVERSGGLVLLATIADAEGDHEASLEYWRRVLEATDPERDGENYRMAVNNIGYWLRKVGRLEESRSHYRKLRELSDPETILRDHANLALAAEALRGGRAAEARVLLVGYERPDLGGELGDFEVELWPLQALLDGAEKAEWDAWEAMVRERGAEWLLDEVEKTRERTQ
ncbi:MAG: protein kinase domain-containing protein [Nannocystaceae bacterium]|nr:protein kinase [bacterium]